MANSDCCPPTVKTHKLFPSSVFLVAPRYSMMAGSECSSPTLVGPFSCKRTKKGAQSQHNTSKQELSRCQYGFKMVEQASCVCAQQHDVHLQPSGRWCGHNLITGLPINRLSFTEATELSLLHSSHCAQQLARAHREAMCSTRGFNFPFRFFKGG